MTRHKQHYPLEVEDPDDLAELPSDQVVTGEQLKMRPGRTLAQKARELGVTQPTLRLWSVEWRGSGYDLHYRIRRAGHSNWLKNKYSERDWPALVREEIAKGRARHLGDILFAVGLTASNAQCWGQKHATFEQALFHSDVPCPKNLWPRYLGYIRHATLDRYRELKAALIADGVDETTARHQAGDQAVDELKHKTRQRRRVERDTLIGVTMHEEMTKRWRKGGRLRDAHSKRIARKLVKVARYAAMERGLRQSGMPEKEIKAKIGELKTAIAHSPEDGQANWQNLRKGILGKKSRTEAQARADQAEARAIKQMPSVRATKYVKQQLAAR